MIVKFFLGIAIIGFTTYCGYLLAKKYHKRKLFFQQFYQFNERFLNEITYFKRPILEWISEYTYTGEFLEFLEMFFQSIQEFGTLQTLNLSASEFSFLTKEDKKCIEDYFLMFGKGDSISQKTYFSSVKDTLKTSMIDAEKTAKKFADLYIKLGFLCGLLLLILML